MKLIAHRGLFSGPDKDLENRPEQIDTALSKGFDAEVDVWVVDGQKFMLGHDRPQYHITLEWLSQPGLWIHAKNVQALYRLSNLNVFWHENDAYTLTSKGVVWTVNGTPSDNTVIVMPEWTYKLEAVEQYKSYGVCSDYVETIKGFM